MFTLKGYTIFEKIYEGPTVTVYCGREKVSSRPVILKHLHIQHPTHKELKRFEYEYEMTRSVNIPGVIQPRSLIDYKHSKVMIMDDFNSISLDRHMKSHELKIREFLEIAIAITGILGDIHKNNIIHKDIKPHNIILNPETKEIKIIDFSISSYVKKETREAVSQEKLEGTLEYISPEQTGGMNRSIDFRSDLYSLGATMYEMLTGQRVFAGTNPKELAYAHIAIPPIPPHRKKDDIPPILSYIIMKLLSKSAEERYQTAGGLKADLEKCLSLLEQGGIIWSFPLAQNDIPDTLIIPESLYGREEVIQIFFDELSLASKNESRMILLKGPPGIGKSTLIKEIRKSLVQEQKLHLSGKFDRFSGDTPYVPFAQAFRNLVGQIFKESAKRVDYWKRKILTAVGENGQLLIEAVPEIEVIIGPQPAIPDLPPGEAQNRFTNVFINFILAFIHEKDPFVLFIDDLQWADRASLNILEVLLQNRELENFLFIGSYRDDERHDSFYMQNSGIKCKIIELNPLNTEHISQIISHSLSVTLDEAETLADIVKNKTGGNPFFVHEFLINLYEEGYIQFDGRWRWDFIKIFELDVTENVVEFMAVRIKKLPQKTREALQIASCFGIKFTIDDIACAAKEKKEEKDIFENLKETINEGIIIKTGEYMRFAHDRVKEAVYMLMSKQERMEIHYTIGNMLLAKTSHEDSSEKIFTIVNQLNRAAKLVLAAPEKIKLAQLNLIAGLICKNSSAYDAAKNFFSHGIDILPEDSWQNEYDLTFSLCLENGEAGYLSGDFIQSDIFLDAMLKNAKTVLDKVKINVVKIISYTSLNRYKEGLETGKKALKILGYNMPKKANTLNILKEITAVRRSIGKKNIEDLANLPELKDPHKLAIVRILSSCLAPSYICEPEYIPILILKLLNYSLKHGNSVYVPYAYAAYGMILCGTLGEIEKGYKFGELSLITLEKFNAGSLCSKVYFIFGHFIIHWKKHYREGLSWQMEAYRSGLETGDFEFASYGITMYFMTLFFTGQNINEIMIEYEKYFESLKNLHILVSIESADSFYQFLKNMAGEADNRFTIKGKIFDENKTVSEWRQEKILTQLGQFALLKQVLFYVYDDYKGSINAALEVEQFLTAMISQKYVMEHTFYYSLALIAHCAESEDKGDKKIKKKKYLQQILKNQ
ncbi:MAG: serine/threonine-protein kinase PknK [bacterium]|nr:serine/threonine-protein kinase PknK [bacterium]